MGKPQRDRVTIDLRGLREPLQAHALVNQMTPAALVRQAVLVYLAPKSGDQKPDPKPLKYVREEQVIKVTLRLPQEGRRRLQGQIVRIEGGNIVFKLDGAKVDDADMSVAFENVDKAKIVPDWVALGFAPQPKKAGPAKPAAANKLAPKKAVPAKKAAKKAVKKKPAKTSASKKAAPKQPGQTKPNQPAAKRPRAE